jgi:hypothetical protein
MKNSNKTSVILHGECMIFGSCIPASAVKKDMKNKSYLIVADSETTGNHHVVDCSAGVNFFDNGGVTFMEVEEGAKATVRCLHAERHDVIEVPAGTYEFGTQQEYDPFTARMNKVRD